MKLMVREPCVVALMVASLSAARVYAQTEFHNFANERGATARGWIGNGNNQDSGLGTDFGFSKTSKAGGKAGGEIGGTFARLVDPVAYYADGTIGLLTLDTPLSASGRVFGSNINWDGAIGIGWFDREPDDSPPDFLGLYVAEPRPDDFRSSPAIQPTDGSLRFNTAGNVSDNLPIVQNTSLSFSIQYDPSGGDFGLIIATVGDNTDTLALTEGERLLGAKLNSFGLLQGGIGGGNNATLQTEFFLDDLRYTVSRGKPNAIPEPSTLVLAGLGLLFLLAYHRSRRYGLTATAVK